SMSGWRVTSLLTIMSRASVGLQVMVQTLETWNHRHRKLYQNPDRCQRSVSADIAFPPEKRFSGGRLPLIGRLGNPGGTVAALTTSAHPGSPDQCGPAS